jgi:hypothetical protein
MKSIIFVSALLTLVTAAEAHINAHHARRHIHNVRKGHAQQLKRNSRGEGKDCVATEWVTVTEYQDSTSTVYIDEEEETPQPATKPDAQFFNAPTAGPENKAPKYVLPVPPAYQEPPAAIPTVRPNVALPPAPAPDSGSESDSESESPPAAPAPKGSENSDTASMQSGVLTYYTVGLGACGEDDSGKDHSDYILALSHEVMGPKSNGNSFCGKKVKITAEGKTIIGVIKDKCMGCTPDHIDGSEKIFLDLFGSLDKGKCDVKWSIL